MLSAPTFDQFWGKWNALTQVPKWAYTNMEGAIRVNNVLKHLHCPRLKLLVVVASNSDRDRQDLDALYRVEDNRLELLEEKNYVDAIFDWERGTV